jgi:hypothetical protein
MYTYIQGNQRGHAIFLPSRAAMDEDVVDIHTHIHTYIHTYLIWWYMVGEEDLDNKLAKI